MLCIFYLLTCAGWFPKFEISKVKGYAGSVLSDGLCWGDLEKLSHPLLCVGMTFNIHPENAIRKTLSFTSTKAERLSKPSHRQTLSRVFEEWETASSNYTVLDVIFHTLLTLLSSDIHPVWDNNPENDIFEWIMSKKGIWMSGIFACKRLYFVDRWRTRAQSIPVALWQK